MRPQEEQHRASTQFGKGLRLLRADVGFRFQRRRGFTFQVEQVDVLLNALTNRGIAVTLYLLTQILERTIAFAAGGEYLGLHLDRSA